MLSAERLSQVSEAAGPGGYERGWIPAPGAAGGGWATVHFGQRDTPVDIVFLHANGFNALTYRSVLSPLAKSHHILAIDQRGHGRTKLPTTYSRRSWDDLAEDLVTILERIGRPVVVSGHSLGATSSILAAGRAPHLVSRLVLFEPVILEKWLSGLVRLGMPARWIPSLGKLADGALRRRATFPTKQAALDSYRGRGAFKTWREDQISDYLVDGLELGSDGLFELTCSPSWESSNFSNQAHDVWKALINISCPVHIIKGSVRSTCVLNSGDLENLSIDEIEGATHFLPVERENIVRCALIN